MRELLTLSVVLAVSCAGGSTNETPQGSGPEPSEETAELTDEGWTDLNGEDANHYYVSSSSGSDDNPGTEEEPFKSVNRGLESLEAGDWVHFKRGDTFTEGIRFWVNGISKDRKTVLTAYGDEKDPRPFFDGAGLAFTGAGTTPDTAEHVAITSLAFGTSKADPDSEDFSADVKDRGGIFILRQGNDVLIEDVYVQFGNTGMNIQGEGGLLSNVVIRRSVIVDSYSTDSHSQGIFMKRIAFPVMSENVIDHNGWNADIEDAEPTKFSQNVYIQSDCIDPQFLENITSRAAANGFQLRPGGEAIGNLAIANPIAGYVSNNNFQEGSVSRVVDNVAIHAGLHGLPGIPVWGLALNASDEFDALPSETPELIGNLLLHSEPPASSPLGLTDLHEDPERDGYLGAVVEDNVVYAWGDEPSDPGPFKDPTRTIITYMRDKIKAPADEQSVEGFLARARKNRRGNWDLRFTAAAVREYLEEGYELAE